MRPYRGQRIDNGETVYGWLRPLWQAVDGPERWVIIDDSHTVFENDGWTIADGEHEVHPKTVAQSIGLKDKNGKEAYGGDLIEHDKKVYEIRWCEEGMGFYCDGNDWIDDAKLIRRSVIIGNIHDNPELLK